MVDSNSPAERGEYQRARRPDEREARAASIKAGAKSLIDGGMPLGGVLLGAIAKAAGMSSPGLYTYFPGREAILVALAADEIEAWLVDLVSRLEAVGDGDRPAIVDHVDASLAGRQTLLILLGALASLTDAVPAEVADESTRRMRAKVDALADQIDRITAGTDGARTVRLLRALIVGLWSFTTTDADGPSSSEQTWFHTELRAGISLLVGLEPEERSTT